MHPILTQLPHPLAFASLPVLEETVFFLLCAVIVSLLGKRFKFPYTVGLVVMGLIVGFIRQHGGLFQGEGHFELTDEVILLVFLPPLLFEGAMNLDWRKLWTHRFVILLLAFVGTAGSILLIAAASRLVIGWDWQIALLFGVVISPTDPVSVLAIFREQGVTKGLAVLVEGESLFNDGLSVVLYLVLLSGISLGWEMIEPGAVLLTIGQMVLGGALVGSILGVAGNRILERIEDHLIEVLVSIVLAYGSYLLAERLHCSGVIAVVFAGLLFGNVGRATAMSPTTLMTVNTSWEIFAFLANSLVFLAMGFVVELDQLFENATTILLLFFAMLGSRSLLTYGLAGLDHRLRRPYPAKWLHVINWGGLKGTIPVALALGLSSVPSLVEVVTPIQTLTFGVVLLSLLFQGLTIKPLLQRLGLNSGSGAWPRVETCQARILSIEAALSELSEIEEKRSWPQERCEKLRTELEHAAAAADRSLSEILKEHPELSEERDREVYRQLLVRQRGALEKAHRRGLLGEEVLIESRAAIDALLAENAPQPLPFDSKERHG